MLLEGKRCYTALLSRDPRFDGRFFVGVTSTGIYCRPVCGVRPPQFRNCRFFVCAAAAEVAGFRPCLRCRPELAPGLAGIDASARLAESAAARLRDTSAEPVALPAIALDLGVSDRHLRRVFAEHFGVSPVQYAQTQRLLLAKRLLTDTSLPVTEVALASGFRSLRRFNALFASRYRLSPGSLRKAVPAVDPARPRVVPQFELAFRPPFDWQHLLRFLGARAIPGVELVRDGLYARTVRTALQGKIVSGVLEVRLSPRPNYLRVSLSANLLPLAGPILERVKLLFDLSSDPGTVAESLTGLSNTGSGIRVPGSFDGFELLVRAILGQQVSVKAARTLAGRIASKLGAPLDTPPAELPELSHTFPTAKELASQTPDALVSIGVTGARAWSLHAAAEAIASGALSLTPGAPIHESLQALRALPGIGEWTAQYVAMRALAWPDAFPHSDLILRRALGDVTPRRCLEIAEQWRPWRAYAAIHLWNSMGGANPEPINPY